MNLRPGVVLILALGSILGLQMPTRAGPQQNRASYPLNNQNKDAVLSYLRPILDGTGYAGRVYYGGSCQADALEFVSFPQVGVHPTEGNMALSAVREMFRGDTEVRVAEEPHRIISVRIGEPSTAILATRISMFRIAPIAAYNPSLAIGAVENTREVKAEMARLGIHVPLQLSEQLLTKPSRGLAHLPAVMKDVTVDQVLNSIASTFHGIVIYGNCAKPDGKALLEIDFTGLDGAGE